LTDIRVNRSLTIPENELRLSFTPSGKPGGQHANKVATRAEVSWNVATSRALGPIQRNRILFRLATRIDSSGTLRVASDRYRSQLRNREDAQTRLAQLVAGALRQPKARRPTAPTTAAKERRMADKKIRAGIKRSRRPPNLEDQ
jgi:ribosome-associated protein